MKIAKKFKEEIKLANFEKEELIVRLDESNKKNELLRNQFSSKDKKMKSLEQKLAKVEAKLENFSNTKLALDNRFVSISIPVKPKDKIYIPPFKRNHKEKAYFVRLDKGKSTDKDILALKLIPAKHRTKRSTAPAYPPLASWKPMEDLGEWHQTWRSHNETRRALVNWQETIGLAKGLTGRRSRQG